MVRTLLVACAAVALAGPTAAMEIGPAPNWCAMVNALPPGGELILRPGEYPGPCTIRRGGVARAPIVVRAKDPDDPPRIVYQGREHNVLSVRAGYVVLRGLQFGPTRPDVDAVRIHRGDGVVVEGCRFQDLGGIAVVANSASLRGLVVRGNRIVDSHATAMYFGCHDGTGCVVSDLLVEGNFVHHVSAPAELIGYGIQVKLNSSGIIRDNVVVDTKGPGIMVYGARDPGATTLVERNFVAGSRTSAAIVVGGGPATVRNNIAVDGAEGGIALLNYGGRDLLHGIAVVHNSLHGNAGGGILAPRAGALDAVLVDNLVDAAPDTPALPPARPGLLARGNADCALGPCFVDPAARDFSPVAPRPGVVLHEGFMPADDYYGRPRGMPPTAGALEGPAGPIPLGPKLRPR